MNMIKILKLILLSFTIVIVSTLFTGCNKTNNHSESIADINKFLNDWHRSASVSDHSAYIGAMAEGAVYIGTDASEYWTTSEFSEWSKPYFDQGKGWNLIKLNRNIYLGENNDFAWFDELLDTGMGLCRGSGVLQKKNGQWRICQYVLSPTLPNKLINQVKALKAVDDSLMKIMLKQKPTG